MVAVYRDLHSVYHVGVTCKYLEKLFAVDLRRLEKILQALESDNVYDSTTRRWKRFPKTPQLESELYEPLAIVTRAISAAAKKSSNPSNATSSMASGAPPSVNGIWLDRHAISPTASNDEPPDIRPDHIFVTVENQEFMTKCEDEIQKLQSQIRDAQQELQQDDVPKSRGSKRKMAGGETSQNLGDRKGMRDKLHNLHKATVIWWRQIHVALDVKLKRNDPGVMRKMCDYLRLILGEQHDRRYVIGLTLCLDELQVWLCDRTGVLGMVTPINIHEEPLGFIQVIAAISTMGASSLGWDPSMFAYSMRTGEKIQSYKQRGMPDFEENRERETDKMTWLIHSAVLGPVITIRSLNVLGEEVMRGRATIVWEVVKEEDLEKYYKSKSRSQQIIGVSDQDPEVPKIYVLKRYWQSLSMNEDKAMFEGDLYGLLPDEVRKDYMVGFAELQLDGELDTTLDFIRRGIKSEPRLMKPAIPNYKIQVEKEDNVRSQTTPRMALVPTLDHRLQNRCHSETVTPHHGIFLAYFQDNDELSSAIIDALTDYEQFYKKGVVHRDVHIGNILILWRHTDKRGRLIDFDQAKHTDLIASVKKFTSSVGKSELDRRQWNLAEDHSTFVTDEVIRSATGIVPPTAIEAYVSNAVRASGVQSTQKNPITCQHLHWPIDSDTMVRPSFSGYKARKLEKTGTLPYMSSEVILNDFCPGSIYVLDVFSDHETDTETGNSQWFHDAIHDMESFFWVFVEICLTRKGPGINMQRDELDRNSPKFDEDLKAFLTALFYADDPKALANFKSDFMSRPHKIFKIIDRFHPYFNDFKDLVRGLWRTLYLGYRFRGYEYHDIIRSFIRQFEDARSSISTVEDLQASQKEVDRRQALLDENLRIFNSYKGGVPFEEPNILTRTPNATPVKERRAAPKYSPTKSATESSAPKKSKRS